MMVTREVHFLMGSLPLVLGLLALKASRAPPLRGLTLQATLLNLYVSRLLAEFGQWEMNGWRDERRKAEPSCISCLLSSDCVAVVLSFPTH